ncbi:MAG: pyrimidine-nucleoside phosphorylase, partial [bacterium]
YKNCRDRIQNGECLETLETMITNQSGDPAVIEDYSRFPEASEEYVVEAEEDGWVNSIDAYDIGMGSKSLGAGRETMDSELDYGAGIELHRKVGDEVRSGDRVATLKYNKDVSPDTAKQRVLEAYEIHSKQPEERPLVFSRLTSDGTLVELDKNRPE